MTGHRGSTKRAKKRGKTSVPGPRRLASVWKKRTLVVVVVAVVLVVGWLAAGRFLREEPQPAQAPIPTPPPAETNTPTPPPVQLSPEEKTTALKAEELRLAQHLVTAFPNSEQPLVLLGDMYRRRGALDQGVEAWEKAVRMNPKRGDVYDRIAQAAFETDGFEEAIAQWREGLETIPSLRGAHTNIARSLMRLGQYEESLPELQEEVKQHPDIVLNYFLLGRTHQHLRNYEESKTNYEKAIELKPDHMNAYYGLYNVCARLKQQEAAKRYLAEFKQLQKRDEQQVRELDETTTDLDVYSRSLARLSFEAHELYRAAGNMGSAEELLKQAVALDPENTTFLERLVMLFRSRNQTSEALALCHRIARIDPTDATCQLNIGILSARTGQFETAEKAFRKAIEISPEYDAGYQELARLYLHMRKSLPQAKELARQAVALKASDQNHYVLGLTCLANDDRTSALARLRQATKLEPKNAKYAETYHNIRKEMASK